MKLLKNILFFTVVTIMIGHDIVPHSDLTDLSVTEDLTVGAQSVESEHLELSHIFEHFKHSKNERNLDYVLGKVQDIEPKVLTNLVQLSTDWDLYVLWCPNQKQFHFGKNPEIPSSITSSVSSLRGPPSC